MRPSARLPGRSKVLPAVLASSFAHLFKKNVVQPMTEDPRIALEEGLPVGLGNTVLLEICFEFRQGGSFRRDGIDVVMKLRSCCELFDQLGALRTAEERSESAYMNIVERHSGFLG